MRKFVLVGICSVVLVMVPPGVGAWASPHDDPFGGSWTSIDTDGSHQTLDIRGSGRSGRRAMVLFDDATSGVCSPSPARIQGSAVVEGDSLLMTGTLTCLPGGNRLTGRISIHFVYESGTDTLVDDSGVVWHRA